MLMEKKSISLNLQKELIQMGFAPFYCKEKRAVLFFQPDKEDICPILLYFNKKDKNAFETSQIILSVCSYISQHPSEYKGVGVVFGDEEVKEDAKKIEMSVAPYLIGISLSAAVDLRPGMAALYLIHNMAAKISVDITGLTAHGAAPHLGINAVDAAALAISAAQFSINNIDTTASIRPILIDAGQGAINKIPDAAHIVLEVMGIDESNLNIHIRTAKNAIEKAVCSIGAIPHITEEINTIFSGKMPDGRVHLALEKSLSNRYKKEQIVPYTYCKGTDRFHFYEQIFQADAGYLGLPLFEKGEKNVNLLINTATSVFLETVKSLRS